MKPATPMEAMNRAIQEAWLIDYTANHQPMRRARPRPSDVLGALTLDGFVLLPVALCEAALTDFIYAHGSDFDAAQWPGMAALRSVLDSPTEYARLAAARHPAEEEPE